MTESLKDKILSLPHGFLYPASLYRFLGGAPGVEVRRAVEELVQAGELEQWEVPSYQNRLMESEAKPGAGNTFEGLLDDGLDEIYPDMVTAVVAYRHHGAPKASL